MGEQKITKEQAEAALRTLTYNLPDWARYDKEIAEAANLLLKYIKQQ